MSDSAHDDSQEALAIVREIALLKDCDEEKSECRFNSGPCCDTHGDNYLHKELITRARNLIQSEHGKREAGAFQRNTSETKRT